MELNDLKAFSYSASPGPAAPPPTKRGRGRTRKVGEDYNTGTEPLVILSFSPPPSTTALEGGREGEEPGRLTEIKLGDEMPGSRL